MAATRKTGNAPLTLIAGKPGSYRGGGTEQVETTGGGFLRPVKENRESPVAGFPGPI